MRVVGVIRDFRKDGEYAAAENFVFSRAQRQLVGEVVILTTAAAMAGVVIVVQFPILRVFDVVGPGVYAASPSMALALIYLLTAACAWAPGRMASAVQPAEALRYE